MEKTYLGDAVYADVSRGMVLLTVEYGMGPTEKIYMELPVFTKLVMYVEAAILEGAFHGSTH